MFNTWDNNAKDNRISTNEFRVLYNNYGCSNEGADAMFTRIDTDGSGNLSVPEFKTAWEYFHGWDCQLFDEYGGDNDEDYDYDDEEYGDDGDCAFYLGGNARDSGALTFQDGAETEVMMR